MSAKGIKRFAEALSYLQIARGELMTLATGERGKHREPIDKVDLRLAQMLDEAKDAVKSEFARITVSK